MNQLNSGTLDKSSTYHVGGTRLINPKFTFDSLPIQMLQNYWWLTKSLVSTGYHNWLLCHKHRLIIWRLPRCCTALYRVFAFRCSGHANFEGYGGAWTRCQPWLSDAACEEQWVLFTPIVLDYGWPCNILDAVTCYSNWTSGARADAVWYVLTSILYLLCQKVFPIVIKL